MIDLLPSRNELKPVMKDSAFYECGFNIDFNKLSFENKLQVLCDIVRQSVYPSGKPDPDNDIKDMKGNCYTSSFILMNYLKELNLGSNHRCVFARKRSFDLDEVTTIHVVLLVDNEGHTYQVDSAPFVGYKYGSVDDITYHGIYDEYVLIDRDINSLLNKYRKIIIDENYVNVEECIRLCNYLDEYPILKGYASLALKCIKGRITSEYDKSNINGIINKIKPYNSSNTDNVKLVKERLNKEYEKWYSELNDLVSSNTNYKRQLELLVWINQEHRWYDKSKVPLYNVNGIYYKLSAFTPRFMLDNNLSCIISDKDYDGDCVHKYYCDFTDKLNYIPFSNIDKGHVVLLNGCNTDGLLTSNNCVDSSLYFLSGYPYEMVMTKFMYPNPKLIKK